MASRRPARGWAARDKLTLARQLARLKVDIIEAGYPASSPEDFEAVQRIAQEIDGPVICALSRAVPDDIEACGKALAKAKRPRIHTGDRRFGHPRDGQVPR